MSNSDWIVVALSWLPGIVGAVTGVIGLVIAHQANRTAREAKAIQERAEARKTERNDVRWSSPEWISRGVCRITNEGLDPAASVRVYMTADGEQALAVADLVRPGESVELQLPKLGARSSAGPSPSRPRLVLPADAAVEVTWLTPLDQARQYSWDGQLIVPMF